MFVLMLLVIIVMNYWLAVVIHELGHVFVGKLVGTPIVLARIGNLVWLYGNRIPYLEENKYIFTPGECLILSNDQSSSRILALGGIIFNAITGSLILIIIIRMKTFARMMTCLEEGNYCGIDLLVGFSLLVGFLFSMICTISNLFPSKREMNDGRLFLNLKNQAFFREFSCEQQRRVFMITNGIVGG